MFHMEFEFEFYFVVLFCDLTLMDLEGTKAWERGLIFKIENMENYKKVHLREFKKN